MKTLEDLRKRLYQIKNDEEFVFCIMNEDDVLLFEMIDFLNAADRLGYEIDDQYIIKLVLVLSKEKENEE